MSDIHVIGVASPSWNHRRFHGLGPMGQMGVPAAGNGSCPRWLLMAVGKGAGCVEDVPGASMLKLKGFFKQCSSQNVVHGGYR